MCQFVPINAIERLRRFADMRFPWIDRLGGRGCRIIQYFLYPNHDIAFPSPSLTKADDGAGLASASAARPAAASEEDPCSDGVGRCRESGSSGPPRRPSRYDAAPPGLQNIRDGRGIDGPPAGPPASEPPSMRHARVPRIEPIASAMSRAHSIGFGLVNFSPAVSCPDAAELRGRSSRRLRGQGIRFFRRDSACCRLQWRVPAPNHGSGCRALCRRARKVPARFCPLGGPALSITHA